MLLRIKTGKISDNTFISNPQESYLLDNEADIQKLKYNAEKKVQIIFLYFDLNVTKTLLSSTHFEQVENEKFSDTQTLF